MFLTSLCCFLDLFERWDEEYPTLDAIYRASYRINNYYRMHRLSSLVLSLIIFPSFVITLLSAYTSLIEDQINSYAVKKIISMIKHLHLSLISHCSLRSHLVVMLSASDLMPPACLSTIASLVITSYFCFSQ